ncbi:outer membrane protein [Phreatobacter sp.]|uniref:outer membrane protein n=1 Tax=Phreatobacter sp. TaxID=1966341 RepID=UPI0025F488DF|nr:outer membrane protein [Phreatobacter sp.]
MKKFLLASAAIAALATGAQAADLGAPRAPIAASVYAPAFSWTGFYLGGHVGYGWAQARYTSPIVANNGSVNANGFLGGIQAGYNWQMNNFVFGLEADVAGGAMNRTFALGGGNTYRASVPFLSTVRARAGVAADRALFYVTGGLGIASLQDRWVIGGVTTNATTTRAGYVLGAGVEYAFTPNWTAKVEYNYYGFGDRRNLVTPGDRQRTDIHTVKLGINYLFSTGPSAVVARY